ncbi:hypothetical protein HLV38_02775 [Berryella wangjianweii]|uniref:Uncharacterized protein n=1 Tax=Berryella wangjianweii TaxID=2734634 RepID=A0A6M8J5C2_9ACTN|nr:hypothetical protein [Berryella wangjianweii]QKF07166.1 hypothetical protein HLV38_02775 [Berryella wangjianweii]
MANNKGKKQPSAADRERAIRHMGGPIDERVGLVMTAEEMKRRNLKWVPSSEKK